MLFFVQKSTSYMFFSLWSEFKLEVEIHLKWTGQEFGDIFAIILKIDTSKIQTHDSQNFQLYLREFFKFIFNTSFFCNIYLFLHSCGDGNSMLCLYQGVCSPKTQVTFVVLKNYSSIK